MSNKEMSFLEHLGELRGHLVRSVIAIIIGAVIIGYNINWVVDNIILYPTRGEFPTFNIINDFTLEYFGEKSILLPEKFPIQVRKLYEQFNVMMSISIFGGVLLAFPYIVWELWRFISPALLANEKKYSLIFINGTWMLFFIGCIIWVFYHSALCGEFRIFFQNFR